MQLLIPITVLLLATTAAAITNSPPRIKAAEGDEAATCVCGSHVGTFCGDRRADIDSQGAPLTGPSCEGELLYLCREQGRQARRLARCGWGCYHGELLGEDGCNVNGTRVWV